MNTMRELVMMGGTGGILQGDMVMSLLGFLLAFILGQAAAWVYIYTHQGLSYSRAFTQSIVMLSVIVAMAMMVIGSNIVIAFGLIGALSVIRFRNILKDTRDTAFIFFALINGMATGTQNYEIAVVGSIVTFAVILYLHWASFGSLSMSDGFLRLHLDSGVGRVEAIQTLLGRHCRDMHLVSERFNEDGMGEVAYRLVMRNPRHGDCMVSELRGLEGVSNVAFILQEEQAEV